MFQERTMWTQQTLTFLAKEEEKAEDEMEASSIKDVRDETSVNNMHKSNKELNLNEVINLREHHNVYNKVEES